MLLKNLCLYYPHSIARLFLFKNHAFVKANYSIPPLGGKFSRPTTPALPFTSLQISLVSKILLCHHKTYLVSY